MTKQRTKISISTLGCKVNQYDSAALVETLKKNGCDIVPFDALADVCIINTCVVTSRTESQSRQLIRRALKSSPQSHIVATGCYAQKSPEDLIALSDRVHVFGNREKEDIPLHVPMLRTGCRVKSAVSDISMENSFTTPACSSFFDRTRAFLKIQDGCNSKCSYCIVPRVRGPSRSLNADNVVTRVKQFAESGYPEVVLTGIHLGAYGLDLVPRTNMCQLLKSLESDELLSLCRIRLSSIEPTEFSDELINFISQSRIICSHLHIPLQSGDAEILRRMGRSYSPVFFKNLIERLKTDIADLNIGIDIIAGFPGETDEHFQNTVKFVQALQVGYFHVFPYSRRQGTAAARLDNQVPEPVKRERVKALRQLSLKKKQKFYALHLNRSLSVIAEGKQGGMDGILKGFSKNYIPVFFKGSDELIGKNLWVKTKEVRDDKVFALIE